MKGKARGIKCRNCRHVIWYDDVDNVWHHKHMLHSDNCECGKPEPNWKPIQKAIKEEFKNIKIETKPFITMSRNPSIEEEEFIKKYVKII